MPASSEVWRKALTSVGVVGINSVITSTRESVVIGGKRMWGIMQCTWPLPVRECVASPRKGVATVIHPWLLPVRNGSQLGRMVRIVDIRQKVPLINMIVIDMLLIHTRSTGIRLAHMST